MDGDGQTDLGELDKICKPVVSGEVDYVKGNRLHQYYVRKTCKKV